MRYKIRFFNDNDDGVFVGESGSAMSLWNLLSGAGFRGKFSLNGAPEVFGEIELAKLTNFDGSIQEEWGFDIYGNCSRCRFNSANGCTFIPDVCVELSREKFRGGKNAKDQ